MLTKNRPKFFGENLTDKECEVIQLDRFGGGARVFRKHLGLELQLMQTKWYDYRLLHPVVATYLYAYEYDQAYKKYYQMTRDYEVGKFIKGYKGADAWLAKNSGGFIKGRQQADEMGIPYDFYISSAYNFLYIKKWKHIPRQCHLYAQDVLERIESDWLTYSKSTLVLSKDSFFKDIYNKDRPEYISHQQWLEDRIALSKVKDAARESLQERGFNI